MKKTLGMFVFLTVSSITYAGPNCDAKAIQEAERTFNQNYVTCFGDGQIVPFDSSDPLPDPAPMGSRTLRVAVFASGPNWINCSSKAYDVQVDSFCNVKKIKFIGVIND